LKKLIQIVLNKGIPNEFKVAIPSGGPCSTYKYWWFYS